MIMNKLVKQSPEAARKAELYTELNLAVDAKIKLGRQKRFVEHHSLEIKYSPSYLDVLYPRAA